MKRKITASFLFGANINDRSSFAAAALLCLLVLSLYYPAISNAQQETDWIPRPESGLTLQVPLFKSRILQLKTPVKKISIGNPAIADILILRAQQIYVVGKALGTTNVVLWDRDDRVITTVNLEVTHDLATLKLKLHELLPTENIEVRSSQRSLVLSGQASSLVKMEAALELARSFLPTGQRGGKDKGGAAGGVVNFMQIGGAQQVMLEVKVAELSRTLGRIFDIDFNAILNSSNLAFGLVSGGAVIPSGIPLGADLPLDITDNGVFANFESGDFMFNSVLNAARDKGLAKILAEPTLTTLTGQEATFISGGEFPIPVPGGGGQGTVTIEFKEFGIGLRFLPVILDSGRINLKVNVTVSELAEANSVVLSSSQASESFFVPALTKRSASSTVELADGQTLGIAGLISEQLRETSSKFPGLGDIPIFGLLFTSQSFVKGQTELVIFITPHFARPTPPELIRLPTDDFVEPTDWEFYLLGRIEGTAPPKSTKKLQGGGTEGQFGHDL